ncbi:MAG: ABC-F family ATP-binding cassette domain-containing protein [Sphingomonadales bacterium]|nr:ABC-F family ATP-binding cassette domain-containing protein [Sphingomonadales bacterium]
MVTVQQLTLSAGGEELVEQASFQLGGQDRAALIGRNGCGKSTLLRALARPETGGGRISVPKNLKIGYFHQDLLSFSTSSSLLEVVSEAFGDLIRMRIQYEGSLLSDTSTADIDYWQHQADLLDELTRMDAFRIEAMVEETLIGLGFLSSDMERPYNQLSGGWRMRAMLGKVLLQRPGLLLLDEPTNHLDLPAISWLEDFILRYPHSVLLVSHDRTFLNRCCNRIFEIDQKKLWVYKGDYESYEEQKMTRLEQQRLAWSNQQKMLDHEMRFIERFRYKASKARAVQSRIKLLQKKELIDEVQEAGRAPRFRFVPNRKPGKMLMELSQINKSFPGIRLLNEASVEWERGDKIALVGPNGSGKSTLLRILLGTESFDGQRQLGYQVELAYYAQHQTESLNLKNSLLDEALRLAQHCTVQEVRSALGAFLFDQDDMDKPVGILSGGEKARLALSGVLLSHSNTLLLDEPGNHLDMESVEALIDALQDFEGSYVLVAHDRYLLEQVCNKVWYVTDGKIHVYPGPFAEFTERLGEPWKQSPARPAESTRPNASKPDSDQDSASSYEEQKKFKRKLAKAERECRKTEEDLSRAEAKKAILLQKMADPVIVQNFENLQSLQIELRQTEQEISALFPLWESQLEELDQLTECQSN